MDKICKNCKWWGRDWEGRCGLIDLEGQHENVLNGVSIFAEASDDQGLSAYLITGPDFGCNRFDGSEDPLVSNCCGAPARGGEELGICPECLEHCEFEKQ